MFNITLNYNLPNYSLKTFYPFTLFKVKEWTPLVFKEKVFFDGNISLNNTFFSQK
jgi:hypothetical protein